MYNMYVYTGFALPGVWGGVPPTSQKFAHSPPLLLSPTTLSPQFNPIKKIKASFLAVVIAPEPFLFDLYTLWKHRSC